MYKMTVTIKNPSGLHARPASTFIKTAGKYKSKIQIARTDHIENAVNAKSMVMLLSLSAARGASVCISAEGEDEQEAVTALATLFESGFGEKG